MFLTIGFRSQAAGTQTVYSLSANTAGVNVLGATDGIALLQGGRMLCRMGLPYSAFGRTYTTLLYSLVTTQ